jgi:hypothetical protein
VFVFFFFAHILKVSLRTSDRVSFLVLVSWNIISLVLCHLYVILIFLVLLFFYRLLIGLVGLLSDTSINEMNLYVRVYLCTYNVYEN